MPLPLLIAYIAAHGFTVLVMPRSILTEKVARRGYHLTREYTVDPLEGVVIREVMKPSVVTVSASLLASELLGRYFDARSPESHLGYPVIDAEGDLVGVVTRSDVLARAADPETTVADLVRRPPVVAYPDETCRIAAERMAGAGIGRLPVVRREDPNHVSGKISSKRAHKRSRTSNAASAYSARSVLARAERSAGRPERGTIVGLHLSARKRSPRSRPHGPNLIVGLDGLRVCGSPKPRATSPPHQLSA